MTCISWKTAPGNACEVASGHLAHGTSLAAGPMPQSIPPRFSLCLGPSREADCLFDGRQGFVGERGIVLDFDTGKAQFRGPRKSANQVGAAGR